MTALEGSAASGPGVAAPDAVALLSRVRCHVYSGEMSADGHYREFYTGPGAELMLGGSPPPGVDGTEAWNAAVHPDDRERYLQAGLDEDSDTVSLEYRLVGYDGVTRWVLDQMWVRETLQDGRRLVDGVVTDVSELHRRSDEAREATAWLDAAVKVSPAALVVIDREARVRLWNPAAEQLFGWTEEEALGQVAPHVPPEQRQGLIVSMQQMDESTLVGEQEDVRIDKFGARHLVAISYAPVREAGRITGVLAVLTDVTARRMAEDQLRRLAHTDPLTGLLNRALLCQRIEEAVSRPDTDRKGVAVLLLDLDGFKAVNDSFGHAVGDELLLAVAHRLNACLRPTDVAARLGGDEFAMLLDTADADEALGVGRRVLAALAEPFALKRAHVVVTASVGVVQAGSVARSTSDLLRDADVAMYKAKADGKNQIVVFEPSMQERVASRLQVESELRTAIREQQFELHYQPFVNLDSGRVVGLEALVRWRHPSRGLLLPADFIPVAEDTGLIVPLGRWILEAACVQAAAWQPRDSGLLSIAVNLSPRQFHDPELVDLAAQCLRTTGLPAQALTIEITENLLMGDTVLAGTRIGQLRALGIQVAVDDFGTGYSSLAYLRRYPVDVLKIDKSFVAPLADGARPAALVRSIIDLAIALDVDTVAEGVELGAQAETLSRLGCHVAQGYFFARPQPAEQIEQLINPSGMSLPAPGCPAVQRSHDAQRDVHTTAQARGAVSS